MKLHILFIHYTVCIIKIAAINTGMKGAKLYYRIWNYFTKNISSVSYLPKILSNKNRSVRKKSWYFLPIPLRWQLRRNRGRIFSSNVVNFVNISILFPKMTFCMIVCLIAIHFDCFKPTVVQPHLVGWLNISRGYRPFRAVTLAWENIMLFLQ